MYFRNRQAAGKALAENLQRYINRENVLILGLPRGGIPVAFEVAKSLNAPLDVWNVRKLGVPGHEEMAMGALASGGIPLISKDVVRDFGISEAAIEKEVERQAKELARREQAYRNGRPGPEIEGKTVILVDDGLATGATMAAAVQSLRREQPARIVVAVPVGSRQACSEFEEAADETICHLVPDQFAAVGQWYDSFPQTSDEEVRRLLQVASEQFALS